MLVRAKKIVALSVMTLVAAVISLPVVSLAATSPVVTVLSPLAQGLRAPVKVALDAGGNIYVADQRIGGVVRYDTYGTQLQTIRTSAIPSGITFAQDGALLVSQASFVARYDVSTGLETGRLTGGQLQSPVGIAVDNVTGFSYVADSVANQVEVYTASGQFVKAFAKGSLSSPAGISFEKISRQLVVADTLNHRIQFFDVDGNLVKIMGTSIPSGANSFYTGKIVPMQFDAPVAVAFEYSKGASPVLSRMYVVDAFQGNVQAIDPTGTGSALILSGSTNNFIGSVGTANGQLMVPSDAVFDSAYSRLLVVNGFGNVTIFGIDGGTNPIYVDVTAPAFTINTIPAEVTVNTLSISGTVEAGSTVQVVSNGSLVNGVVVNSSWSATVTGLVAGNNSISVTAKDTAGNIAVPQIVNVNYLLPAPVLTISPLSSLTKFATVTITGTVDAGGIVAVSNQTTSTSGNALVSGTTWSFDVALVDGINNLSVTAQKPQSAKSLATVSTTLDTVAPLLTVSALADGRYTSTQVQNISGTATDLNGASVTVNGVAAVLAGNTFSVPVTLQNGANQISVIAVDSANNSTVNNRTIYFDSTKPYITILVPVDNSVTASSLVVLNGSVDKTSAVTVAGVPAKVDANSWSASVELISGVNTIEIVATDLYGNSSSLKRSITLDTVKPELAVIIPVQDIAINKPNVLISGTVSDSTTLSLEYSVNGTVTAVPVVSGIYSFNVDFATEGNYPISLSAKDAAGNITSVVRNVIYDITPPVFTLNQANGVMPEKISGNVESGSSVVVKDGTTQIGSVKISNSSWTADLTGTSYNPENLLVIATDAAGNSTSKTLTYNFPDGTLNGSGKPTVQDALRAIRLVVNQTAPTAQELAHYDIGPLVNGKPNPNGKIEIVDAILILRKALGLKSW